MPRLLDLQPSSMWAKVLAKPGEFRDCVVPAPSEQALEEGSVLLRTLAGGICGSDIPYFRQGKSSAAGAFRRDGMRPGFPMHEVVGEVTASRDDSLPVGTRVVGWADGSDGLCEFVVTRGSSVAPYDHESLSESVAVLVQPIACVLDALQRIGDVNGSRCAVIGLGPIGLLFAHALKCEGAGTVIGIDAVDRSDVAGGFGCDEFVWSSSAAWASTARVRHEPDLVIEAAGHQAETLHHAMTASKQGGRVYYFGVPAPGDHTLNLDAFMRSNLTLSSGITIDRRKALVEAEKYLRRNLGVLATLVTHVFDREAVQRAYGTAAVPAAGRLKVIVEM